MNSKIKNILAFIGITIIGVGCGGNENKSVKPRQVSTSNPTAQVSTSRAETSSTEKLSGLEQIARETAAMEKAAEEDRKFEIAKMNHQSLEKAAQAKHEASLKDQDALIQLITMGGMFQFLSQMATMATSDNNSSSATKDNCPKGISIKTLGDDAYAVLNKAKASPKTPTLVNAPTAKTPPTPKTSTTLSDGVKGVRPNPSPAPEGQPPTRVGSDDNKI